MKTDKRFSNILGKDYNLFAEAIFHHDELQDRIGDILGSFFSKQVNDKFSVIEAGAGTGLTTVRILDSDERINVLAIDNEEKTLNQAKQILDEHKDRITFICKDILDALKTIEDNSVDAFVSAFTIHNLPFEYREKLFPEIHRILVSGGLFLNADKYALDNEEDHKETLDEQIKNFDVYDSINRPDLKKEWTEHYMEDEKIKITENEQIEILKNLNFKNIKIDYRKRMEAIIFANK